jgi:hypothetical protein
VSKVIVDDPGTLANIVRTYGGTPLVGETFRFDLPLASVRDVVPRLNELGVGVRKISERVEDNPTKLFSPQTVATLELYRPQDEKRDRLPEW